MQLIFIMLTVL